MNTNSSQWETIGSNVPSSSPPRPLSKCSKKVLKERHKSLKANAKLEKIKKQFKHYKQVNPRSPTYPMGSNTNSSQWETTNDERMVYSQDTSNPLTHYQQVKDNIKEQYSKYERNPIEFLNIFLGLSKASPNTFFNDIKLYNDNSRHPLKHMFFIIKMTIPTTSRSKLVHNTTFCMMTRDGVYPIDYINVNSSIDPFSVFQISKKKNKSKGIKALLKGLKVAGESICSQEISKAYITEQYTDYSSIAIISFGLHKKETRGQTTDIASILQDINLVNNYDILGFVYCEPYKSYPIDAYIPLICSNKNFGGILLKFIENFVSYIGYEKMQLSAIESAVSYYYFKSNYKFKRGGQYEVAFNYELSKFIKRPIEGSVKTRGGGGENINRVVLNTSSTKQYNSHPKATRKSLRIKSMKSTPHKE